ncbi:BTB/POZ and MATH domain-containing protein 1-like [Ananas comosus]|uniref:BTB/POZ and MATH domain-containing protein 1-like n=1 Tax=Ananas comosus TaxID=4615 RepID=A0A6P5H6Y6_ANACO|nr:BTB/POZ and MATH domain-containing protein 1-like [Ananas comosus]
MTSSSAAAAAAAVPYKGTSSTLAPEWASGSHRFKIAAYSLTKGIGVGQFFESAAFAVGGHDWVVRYYPDGETDGTTDYVSFFVRLASPAAGVTAKFNLTLAAQEHDTDGSGGPAPPPITISAREKPCQFTTTARTWGYKNFVKRTDLEASQYLKDDCLAVDCTVTVLKKLHVIAPDGLPAIASPPSDLHRHLARLLDSGEGTDVAFQVGGETFAAHRCLLAARSPVFRAELFGPMMEKSVQFIRIEDMEPVAFNAMLHFVYSDSLPQFEDPGTSTLMLQHLLAAADRYGMERLRLVCEEKLCRDLSVNMVATTLALAEQHRCAQLKAACLEFVASPGVLTAVMQTDGFEHLRISCPSILTELLEMLAEQISKAPK